MVKKNEKVKIVLSGGHAGSTAFVVIEEIRRQNKSWDISWVGFRSSLEGEKVPSLSSIYFPKYHIKTYGITAGRIQRKLTIHTLPSILKIPLGFIHAFILLTGIKPDLILSFGGFAAFPVVVIGYLLGIPVIIHEQTSVVGRANKYSAFFAKKIAISRESSYDYFPKNKTTLTGNPTPSTVFTTKPRRFLSKIPTIFVTGGQSGSLAINKVIEDALTIILKDFCLVHLTGIKNEKKFIGIRERLVRDLKKRYKVYGLVSPKKFNDLFKFSDIVISRAGANTVSKIIAAKKLSILIPLPISYLDEQKRNALYAKEFGIARILNQDALTPENLVAQIRYITANWNKILQSVSGKESPDKDAAKKLVALIEEFVGKK